MRIRFYIVGLLAAMALTVASCSMIEDMRESAAWVFDEPESNSVKAALKRAEQFSEIKWTPLSDMPGSKGIFEAGVEVKGIPYSSVKELDKFVGFDVSLKTFMTAVRNPRSVLYSENVSQPPYHGVNCSTYYGTVCSSSVSYALGLEMPYTVASLKALESVREIDYQVVDSLRLCDLLFSDGHVAMVWKIARSRHNGNVTRIYVFESGGSSTFITKYKVADFLERWKQTGWTACRYEKLSGYLSYEASPFVMLAGEDTVPYQYNEALCPSRGDAAVYREGEDVIINIFDKSCDIIHVNNGLHSVRECFISSEDLVLSKLAPGEYTAIAFAGERKIGEVSFDVVDTDVTAVSESGNVIVSFRSSVGRADYAALCGQDGTWYATHSITDEERASGQLKMGKPGKSGSIYCKVVFSTPKGTAINEPILLKK